MYDDPKIPCFDSGFFRSCIPESKCAHAENVYDRGAQNSLNGLGPDRLELCSMSLVSLEVILRA